MRDPDRRGNFPFQAEGPFSKEVIYRLLLIDDPANDAI